MSCNCVSYCFHNGMVRLSHTSYTEMFCILMRCMSCHRAGLSVVTHKCCWISDHSSAISVFSHYSNSNAKEQTKMLLNTQNGQIRQNVRKIFLKCSTLQSKTKLSFGYELHCNALCHRGWTVCCPICSQHAWKLWLFCICMHDVFVDKYCLLLDEALKVFDLLRATHKEGYPLVNLLWADVQHTLLPC